MKERSVTIRLTESELFLLLQAASSDTNRRLSEKAIHVDEFAVINSAMMKLYLEYGETAHYKRKQSEEISRIDNR